MKAQRSRRIAPPQEKPHHPHWPLACALFLFVLCLGFFSIHDGATWIHIRTGAVILSQRAIPLTDPFSYTFSGHAWTTDSWLSDALFFALHENFGPKGLILIKSAAAAGAFSLLLPLNLASPLTSAAVLALGAVSGWTGFSETPAIFDLLLLSLFIRLLRPRRPFGMAMLAQAAALEWLWANLHGSTAIIGVWLALLKAFKAGMRAKPGEREEKLGHWGLFAAVFAAFAANPHHFAVLNHMSVGFEAALGGWEPLSPYLNLQNVFWLAGAVSCALMLQQEFFLTMTAATVLGLSVLAPELRPLAILASCPVISLALGQFFPAQDDDLPGVARWAAGMSLLLAVHWVSVTAPLGGSRGYGVVSLTGATRFLKASGIRGRMFNEVETGAPLIGSGDRPVFVDARASLYGPSFMQDARRWPNNFKGLSDVYAFDYAVLLNKRAKYPARILDEDADWRLAFADDTALVYVKRSGASGWLVKDWPAALVRPNRLWPDALDEALADPRRLPKAMEELDRWLLQSPDSAQALLWKAYALDRRNLSDNAERLLDLVRSRHRVWRDPELAAQLGFVLDARGETAAARGAYRRAALIARRRGNRKLESEIFGRLAQSYRRGGDAARADKFERRARHDDALAPAEDL